MSKAQPLPAIVIANDLLSGDVIFLGHGQWELTHHRAAVASDQSAADALLARAKVDVAANRIVDPYLAQVQIGGDGTPVPVHYRERMRTLGPTIRPDLGKQAGL
jgi:Protein of unknown function (DUF2849)